MLEDPMSRSNAQPQALDSPPLPSIDLSRPGVSTADGMACAEQQRRHTWFSSSSASRGFSGLGGPRSVPSHPSVMTRPGNCGNLADPPITPHLLALFSTVTLLFWSHFQLRSPTSVRIHLITATATNASSKTGRGLHKKCLGECA